MVVVPAATVFQDLYARVRRVAFGLFGGLSVLCDVIQPFPTFSEAFLHALRDLETQRG
jgi:hypothetical protein